MNIQTKYQGEVEIADKDIWTFKNGIPGFQDEHQFVILPLPENDIYAVFQSVKTAGLGFIIANPFFFFKEYSFDLDEAAIEQLGLENEADTMVYSILTIQEPFEKTTANLQAPLVFNKKNNQGKQLILNDGSYTTKHRILPQKTEKR
ncbi:flagellar assembly protein FliW [Bacillus infantis]|uniref:flagellar assembly protein FliW n=1 Tax=Bacillus infantis TaxID=324767 RepID=UPI003CED1ADF